jgi:hypothetical protein
MSTYSESPLDRLWKEYGSAFRDFDDLTLARWLAQTLGQISGRVWRLSHPLLGAYRLAAQLAHERQIWLKRLATPPAAYPEASCCRAPLLPLLTRDALEAGLICQHCNDTCLPFEEIPAELQEEIRTWAQRYAPLHAVLIGTTPSASAAGSTMARWTTRPTRWKNCWALPARRWRQNYSSITPPSSGRIRMSVWKCARRISSEAVPIHAPPRLVVCPV